MYRITVDNFDLNQRVSSQLAFALVLLLSFLVAWFTVNASRGIVSGVKNSEIVKVEKRPGASGINK